MSDLEQPSEGLTPEDAPAKRAGQAESEPNWPRHVTGIVATEMRRWREKRGLSAQQLSERTRELGYQVPRSVIANLENNRRDTVSVAELLILAAALDVPPTMLITAVGLEESIEILPTVSTTTWRARGWLLGAVHPDYSSFSLARWQEARRVIALYDVHRLLVREHQQITARIKRLTEHNELDAADAVRLASSARQRRALLNDVVNELAYSMDRIRTHRNLIRNEGFLLPSLPPGLASLLKETDSTGRHHLPGADDTDGPTELETTTDPTEDQLLPALLFEYLQSRGPRNGASTSE
jgi:transcriptional regulator with XRE-family HTH domain